MDIEVKLHDKQHQVFTDDSRFIVLVAGRRFGKSYLACNKLFVKAINKPKSLNWLLAPTYKQCKMIAWRMLKDIIPQELILKANESDLTIKLINNSLIELKGCDNADSLRGAGVDYCVVDEFGIIPDALDLWGAILRPLLADKMGECLFIGTPNGLNSFHDLYQKGLRQEDGFVSYLFHTDDNPYIQRSEIEAMKKELPSWLYEQECLCSFLSSSDRVLIKLQDLESLKVVSLFPRDTRKVISVDPATGGDECVIYAFENTKLIDQLFVHHQDAMKVCGEVMMMSAKHKIDDIAVDTCGIGKPIVDRLAELGKRLIFLNSASGVEDKHCGNLRAAMWWYAMDLIQHGECEYVVDAELKRQLSSVQMSVSNSSGSILLEPKLKTKERLGRSPDRADAYIYGLWALKYVEPYKLPGTEFERKFGNQNNYYQDLQTQEQKSDYAP